MADTITLLTALALTPEADLDAFKRRYLASHAAADMAHVGHARALISAICDALEEPDDAARWSRLRAARVALDASSKAATDVPAGTGTVELVEGSAKGAATLPFAPSATVATAPPGRAPAPAPAWPRGTVAGADAPSAAPLPFGAHELTLEQYAALCAESALDPSNTAAVNARHGLGAPGARGRVDLAWQKRLARDPALREQWRALFEDLKRRGTR